MTKLKEIEIKSFSILHHSVANHMVVEGLPHILLNLVKMYFCSVKNFGDSFLYVNLIGFIKNICFEYPSIFATDTAIILHALLK